MSRSSLTAIICVENFGSSPHESPSRMRLRSIRMSAYSRPCLKGMLLSTICRKAVMYGFRLRVAQWNSMEHHFKRVMAQPSAKNSTLNWRAMEKHWYSISPDERGLKRSNGLRQNPHHGLIKLERFQYL